MIGEMVCPDCGGVVGAAEQTEAGPPCRCFTEASSRSSRSGTLAGGSGVGDSPGSDGSASDVPAPAVVKVCRTCGTDVAGQWRQKDSLGYLCRTCALAERERETQGRVPCRVCGNLVKRENLTEYEGTKMCPKCHKERSDMRLREIKRMGVKGARTRDELLGLYKYLAVGAVLLLVILAGVVYKHFPH